MGFDRPDCIVLHYTGMRDAPSAINRLCDATSDVSCHYVVTEDGTVFQLVDEGRRAWHAGRSFWRGETDLNSASIGIELVNGGHDYGLPDYPNAQVVAVAALCLDIMRRNGIGRDRVLAHSDIAPARKRDPGEHFPWRWLAQRGVGLWPEPALAHAATPAVDMAMLQTRLTMIGFDLRPSGAIDAETEIALRGFQRRYRPRRIDGFADIETSALVDAVLCLHERERQGPAAPLEARS